MDFTHGVINMTKASCTNNDAMNVAGIYTTSDLDNGTLVTLTKMNTDTTTGMVNGYEYTVALAGAGATNVWVVASPEVGQTPEMQLYSDLRAFYNVKGLPMSVKGLLPRIDCIEVTAPLFVGGTLPTAVQIGQYVAPAANGKYAAPVADAPTTGAYFRVEALNFIGCGNVNVPSVVLRCMAN